MLKVDSDFPNANYFSKPIMEIALLIHLESKEIHRHFPKNNLYDVYLNTYTNLFRNITDTSKFTCVT